MQRQLRLIILTTLANAFLLLPTTYGAERTEIVREEISVYGDYRFATEQRVLHDEEFPTPLRMESFLFVYKGTQELTRIEGWLWELDEPPGRDLTGDGSLDVVFTDYSGGAHCCFTRYIIEMREPLNVIEVGTGDGSFRFEEIDGRPGLEIVTTHDFYTEWINGYVGAPFPRIIWRYMDGTYKADPDLMRQPALPDAEFRQLVAKVRDGEWPPHGKDYLPRAFLQTTLDFVYAGNLVQALDFIQATWPPRKPGQADFIAELLQCRMRDTGYWPMLAKLNGLPAEKSRPDCRDREIGEQKPWADADH